MNIRKHLSRRRRSERNMSMRQKRLLSMELERKGSLQDITTRNIDKQMKIIRRELVEIKKPDKGGQRKTQYKFPVPSPVWKRWRPTEMSHNKNPGRKLLSLKSFDSIDENDSNDCSTDDHSFYQRCSTSETLLLFNKENETKNKAFFSLKNSRSGITEGRAFNLQTFGSSNNPSLTSMQQDIQISCPMMSEQNSSSSSLDPLAQSSLEEKPCVKFVEEQSSSLINQSVEGNTNATKKSKEIGYLQSTVEEAAARTRSFLSLPLVRHNGAAAAVNKLFDQYQLPTRTLGLKLTADDRTSLPAAITQTKYEQEPTSYLQKNPIVNETNRTVNDTHEKIQYYPDRLTEVDSDNSNKQKEPIFAGVPDFATLARTNMSSIKKDIARRLSTTAVPTELKKFQWQRRDGAVAKDKLKSLSVHPDTSVSENATPRSGTNQLLLPRQKDRDTRRKSEGGDILATTTTTTSLRRLSLYSPRESPSRQEGSTNTMTSKSPESDLNLRVNKPKEEKPRRKSYLKSLPVYDRELYNPDGSLRTVYCLPSFDECWEQAQQARYIRTREVLDRDRELSVEEVFAKQENKEKDINSGEEQ